MVIIKDDFSDLNKTDSPLYLEQDYMVTTTDIGYYSVKYLNQPSEEIPNCAVDQKKFIDIINSFGSADINFQENELVIKSGGSTFKLGIMKDVPVVFNTAFSVDYEFRPLSDVPIKHLLSTASKDETFDNRQGIYISDRYLASTNGMTISVLDNRSSPRGDDFRKFPVDHDIVMPSSFFKNFQSGGSFCVYDNMIHYILNDFCCGSALLGSEFPNVMKVKDSIEYVNYFEIDIDDLLSQLKNCEILFNKEQKLIDFSISQNKVNIDFFTDTDSYSSEIACESNSEGKFTINGTYLINVLAPFRGSNSIKIQFADESTPINIQGNVEGLEKFVAVSVR